MRVIVTTLALALAIGLSPLAVATESGASGQPATIPARQGWIVQPTPFAFPDLVERLKKAIAAEKMGLVTQASASDGARMQGIEIAGNRVIGVYRNDYARRMLAASVSAGIEAPIRFYVTENPDGTATLSYKTPSLVFQPYLDEGGKNLHALASELDDVFEAIAVRAIRP